MAKKPTPTILERRQVAVEATMRRFQHTSFDLSKADCMKMELHLLKKLGITIPGSNKLGTYRTPVEARKKLRDLWGVKNMVEFNDKFFKRIPPAACLPGDIIAAPAYESAALGGVMIATGNDLALLFAEEHDKPVIGRISYEEGKEPIAAWRVIE